MTEIERPGRLSVPAVCMPPLGRNGAVDSAIAVDETAGYSSRRDPR